MSKKKRIPKTVSQWLSVLGHTKVSPLLPNGSKLLEPANPAPVRRAGPGNEKFRGSRGRGVKAYWKHCGRATDTRTRRAQSTRLNMNGKP